MPQNQKTKKLVFAGKNLLEKLGLAGLGQALSKLYIMYLCKLFFGLLIFGLVKGCL